MQANLDREIERDRRLNEWSTSSGVDLMTLDSGQQWVVFCALTFLSFVSDVAPLRRMVAYLLAHCGMGLSTEVIGAVVGTTGRAVRKGRRFEPAEFWKRLQKLRRGHAPSKLSREQVGPVAKFLADNKRCSVAELLAFIKKTFGVEMDRLTLRRFLKRYGLGCLREESIEDTPFLPVAPSTAEHSS